MTDVHARIADLEAQVAAYQSGQTYSYIGKDGKQVLARVLEDERDALRAQVAAIAGRVGLAVIAIDDMEPDCSPLGQYAAGFCDARNKAVADLAASTQLSDALLLLEVAAMVDALRGMVAIWNRHYSGGGAQYEISHDIAVHLPAMQDALKGVGRE